MFFFFHVEMAQSFLKPTTWSNFIFTHCVWNQDKIAALEKAGVWEPWDTSKKTHGWARDSKTGPKHPKHWGLGHQLSCWAGYHYGQGNGSGWKEMTESSRRLTTTSVQRKPWSIDVKVWGWSVFGGDSLWHDKRPMGWYCLLVVSVTLATLPNCQRCPAKNAAAFDGGATCGLPYVIDVRLSHDLGVDCLLLVKLLQKHCLQTNWWPNQYLCPPPTQHLGDLALMLMYFLILKKASEDTGGKWKRRIR